MKARVKAHALREIITSKDHVLIMGHKMADVDSFGAAVGIYRIARTLERKAQIVLDDVNTSLQPLVDLFKNNPEYESDMFLNSAQAVERAGANTVLVVVDVNKPSLTEWPGSAENLQVHRGAGSSPGRHGDHRKRDPFLRGNLCLLGL